MKFLYYVVHIDGGVVGTNDEEQADQYSMCEDYVVIDVENNETITDALDGVEIKEAESLELEKEESDEDTEE